MLKNDKEKVINVFLVEDNPADARLVAELLKEARGLDIRLEGAETLSAATEAISKKTFDILLLDLSLPDSMGLETFAKVRLQFPQLPVIVFTGLHDEDLGIKALREGAQDYMVKGEADSAILVRAIRYAIERRRLEDRLIKSEKMEAIGHMAGGIAHDFGNILQVIKGNAQMLQEDLGEGSSFHANLEKILSSTEKAINIIQGLHALGRKQLMNPKVVDLNEIIKKFERFILMLIGKNNVALTLKLANRSLYVMADSTQIEQVLMNLAINAKDAMPDGGRLTIDTVLLESSDGLIDEQDLLEPGRFAVLSVSDTGHGIPGEVMDRIFEPFFTTKGEGKGTGLGLSMVYGTIKQHNGHIHCHSKPGAGTTFKIYLPIIASEASH